MNRTPATFALIHGAWHDGSCWEPFAERLRVRGYDVVAPDLPYHDANAGYAERVAPALAALDGVVGELVVVGHSLGSAYAPLVALAHPGSLLVHLCPRLGPFVPAAGAPDPFCDRIPWPEGDRWDEEAAVAFMYARLPPATAREAAHRLRPLAPPAGAYPLAKHPDVPTALVYTTDDEFFTPEFERYMAREVLGVEPIELPGGHFPMLEDPERLADVLVSLLSTRER